MSTRRSSPKRGAIWAAVLACRVVFALGVTVLAFTAMSASGQSSPPADVVFAGGFERGKLSPWGGQCANTGVSSNQSIVRGTVGLTVRLVGHGKYAARFDLPAAGTNNACELLDTRPIGLGTDDYYGLMVFFPKSWREPSPAGWGLAIAQFGYQGIWGSVVGLNAHRRNIALIVQSGQCAPVTSSNPGCAYSSGPGGNIRPMVAAPAPLTLGVWHELIVHVHHAADSSGVIEAWYRRKGQTRWKQTVSLRGYPTVQWTPETLPTLSYAATVDKIGAYRGHADFPVTIWQDGFVRATSFAAAAAALP